jgi:hypothetical protein
VIAGLVAAALVAWHPIHSSLTTVEARPGEPVATLTIKVYAEDFPPGQDPARIRAYLAERVGLLDRRGQYRGITFVSQRIDGPVQWIRATTPIGEDRAELTMRNTLLVDRFRDQVNVVQTRCGGRISTVLFVGATETKRLTGLRC